MAEAERAAAVQQFNEEADVRVFVLHVGAAAAGLTLTAARSMFQQTLRFIATQRRNREV